MIHIFNIT